MAGRPRLGSPVCDWSPLVEAGLAEHFIHVGVVCRHQTLVEHLVRLFTIGWELTIYREALYSLP